MSDKKPRRFKYWIAEHKTDNPCHSLIGRTKKEVVEQLQRVDCPRDFAPPMQREIPYDDLFDFFDWVTGEGAGRACGFIPGTLSRYKD